MNLTSFFAVLIGGSLGSVLRWMFGLALNPVLPALPLGTLAVNLSGGFIIGAAVGVFGHYENLPAEWRLFVITGFCGGFTTFSAFSAETVTSLLRGEYGWSVAIVLAHVCGSLLLTLAGIALVRALLAS
jgi:CrcB protein